MRAAETRRACSLVRQHDIHTLTAPTPTLALPHTVLFIGNSPMEVSSKRPVGRHRNVVDVKTKAGAHFGKAAKTTDSP